MSPSVTDMAPRLMTATEAAAHYQVSLRTIRRWIASGELNVQRPGGRTVRVLVDDQARGNDDEEDSSTTRGGRSGSRGGNG